MNYVFFQSPQKRFNNIGQASYEFGVVISPSYLQWLQRVIARQVKTQDMYLIHYRSLPGAKKEVINRLHKQLDMARNFAREIDGLTKL